MVHVIIVGAGPAGILATIKLLLRNEQVRDVAYTVEVVESSEDLGSLEQASGVKRKRSWMIGLSAHGLGAIKSVPGLYEDYVSKVGVLQEGGAIYLGRSRFIAKGPNDSFIVDRNDIVRAMLCFLNDKFKASGNLKVRYSTKVNFVAGDKRRIFVTNAEGLDEYLPYDLLLGCDGVRSAVRAALVAKHRDFECSITVWSHALLRGELQVLTPMRCTGHILPIQGCPCRHRSSATQRRSNREELRPCFSRWPGTFQLHWVAGTRRQDQHCMRVLLPQRA